MVLTSVLLQALLEFGPLWMVALAAPAIFFGPQWAGLMGAFGLGGLLAGRLRFTEPGTLLTVVGLMLASTVVLATSRSAVVVIVAQVGLALLVVAAGTFLSARLHDCVPSMLRAGVASGVGTLTWIAFLPFSLIFGVVSDGAGVYSASWLFVAVTAMSGAALVKVACARRSDPAPYGPVAPEVDGKPTRLAAARS